MTAVQCHPPPTSARVFSLRQPVGLHQTRGRQISDTQIVLQPRELWHENKSKLIWEDKHSAWCTWMVSGGHGVPQRLLRRAEIFLLKIITEQSSLEGTLKDHLVQRFLGKTQDYLTCCPITSWKAAVVGSLPHPWQVCFSLHSTSSWLCDKVSSFLYYLTMCLKCTSLWGVHDWIPLLSSLQSKYCFSACICANKIELWFHLGPIAIAVIQIITNTRLRFSEGLGKIGFKAVKLM